MPKPTKGPRLGGSSSHQKALLANLATSLFEHGRIKTTEPKARALRDIHHDPDRLRQPFRRTRDGWEPMEWDAAFDYVAERLRQVQRTHGRDAVAVYQGNPSAHNLGLITIGQVLYTTVADATIRGIEINPIYIEQYFFHRYYRELA